MCKQSNFNESVVNGKIESILVANEYNDNNSVENDEERPTLAFKSGLYEERNNGHAYQKID